MQIEHMKMILLTAAALLSGSALAEERHENHAHALAKDVDAFHAVLAPLWHAPPGTGRSKGACAKVEELANLAAAIHSGDAKPLLASVAALKAQCQAGTTETDAALSQLHDAFHRLILPKAH